MIIVESVNFAALLTNFTILDIIMNFLALVVIAEFDEYFFSAVKEDSMVDILIGYVPYGNYLVIQRTTSSNAVWLEDHKKDPINELTP